VPAAETVTASVVNRSLPRVSTPDATRVCCPAARPAGTVTVTVKFPDGSATTVVRTWGEE
jgi:hypothetical protein